MEIEQNIIKTIFGLHEDKRRAQKERTIRDGADDYMEREERIKRLEQAYQEEEERVIQYREQRMSREDAIVCRNENDWEICEDLSKPPITITGYTFGGVSFLLRKEKIPTHKLTVHKTWHITIPGFCDKTITFDWGDRPFEQLDEVLDLPEGQYTIIFDCGRS